MSYPVLILAGGLGTRLNAITNGLLPKPMVEVDGKPFLWWLLSSLSCKSIENIYINWL